jgi:hypothetical protein
MCFAVLHEPTAMSAEQYHRVWFRLRELGACAGQEWGPLSHVCFGQGFGYQILDIWESMESLERFMTIAAPLLEDERVEIPWPTITKSIQICGTLSIFLRYATFSQIGDYPEEMQSRIYERLDRREALPGQFNGPQYHACFGGRLFGRRLNLWDSSDRMDRYEEILNWVMQAEGLPSIRPSVDRIIGQGVSVWVGR